MHLKLEIDGEENLYSFPDQKRVTIGRSPVNDIQILIQGISRAHLEVHEKDNGQFYAVDKGSTHGTFINEQRLVKNKPVSFNSFLPARLGPAVFIYLVDDIEQTQIDEQGAHDSFDNSLSSFSDNSELENEATTIGSLDNFFEAEKKKEIAPAAPKEVKKSSLDDFFKDHDKKVSKKRNARSSKAKKTSAKSNKLKKKNQQKFITYLSILAVIAYVIYGQWQEQKEKEKLAQLEKQKAVQAMIAAKKAEQKKLEEDRLAKIKEQKLKEKERFVKEVLSKDKCLSDTEISFCSIVKSLYPREFTEGVYKETTTLYFILDIKHKSLKYANYKYNDKELETVLVEARRTVGRRFHKSYFLKRKDAKLNELEPSFENHNIQASADFLESVVGRFPSLNDQIQKITVVAVDGEEYLSHYDYSFDKVSKLKKEDIEFTLKMFHRSNIKAPMRKLLKDLKAIKI